MYTIITCLKLKLKQIRNETTQDLIIPNWCVVKPDHQKTKIKKMEHKYEKRAWVDNPLDFSNSTHKKRRIIWTGNTFSLTFPEPIEEQVKKLQNTVLLQAETINRQETMLAQMKATLEQQQNMLLQAQSLLLRSMNNKHTDSKNQCSYIS